MKNFLLIILLSSCIAKTDTVYNYPGAIVVGKEIEFGETIQLRYKASFTVKDIKYNIKWINVPKSEYKRFQINDTIPKQ